MKIKKYFTETHVIIQISVLSCSLQKTVDSNIIIIIISIHEFRPGWPVSVSAVISSRSVLSGRGFKYINLNCLFLLYELRQ
jgi:hypothetical protein